MKALRNLLKDLMIAIYSYQQAIEVVENNNKDSDVYANNNGDSLADILIGNTDAHRRLLEVVTKETKGLC